MKYLDNIYRDGPDVFRHNSSTVMSHINILLYLCVITTGVINKCYMHDT